MRFFIRNLIFIIGALVVISCISLYFNNNLIGYSLMSLALILATARLIASDQHLKKMASQFLKDDIDEESETLTRVMRLLEKRQGQMTNIISAVKKIQEGNLDNTTIDHLEGEAKAAISNLQSNLLSMREQEAKQNWIVKGIAKMGEIRKSNSSLEDYAYQITSTLVKYLEANQGAFYMLKTEEEVLQLLASYA